MGACTTAPMPSRRRCSDRSPKTSTASRWRPGEFIASGSTVAAVVRYTGSGKATGKALDVPAVHVWDVRDGKLARFRQFIDTVKYAEVVPAV